MLGAKANVILEPRALGGGAIATPLRRKLFDTQIYNKIITMETNSWTKPGATLSHKNACKEFGLTEAELLKVMQAGKLQYRQNYTHGNPYYRLLRKEVETLVYELHGPNYLEEQEINHKVKKVSREINSLKRKKKA